MKIYNMFIFSMCLFVYVVIRGNGFVLKIDSINWCVYGIEKKMKNVVIVLFYELMKLFNSEICVFLRVMV